MYVAIAVAPGALACGIIGWRARRSTARPGTALVGIYAGALALLIAVARYGVTWLAVARLQRMLG